MAMQSPFFGKQQRDAEALNARTQPAAGNVPHQNTAGLAGAPGSRPAQAGSMQTASSASAASPFVAPVTENPGTSSATSASGGSKLTVGPNIKLKGVEITDCDTLVVEGLVEATMDSRLMQISEHGAFRGSAEIDIAEIHGAFDGNLTVRQKLTIHTTGRVTGKIRYGKVVIEEGGQLTGDIEFSSTAARMPAAVKPTGIQAAA